MILTEKQKDDYIAYLEDIKSSVEEMQQEIKAHWDSWENFTHISYLRGKLKSAIRELIDFEDYYEWYRCNNGRGD